MVTLWHRPGMGWMGAHLEGWLASCHEAWGACRQGRAQVGQGRQGQPGAYCSLGPTGGLLSLHPIVNRHSVLHQHLQHDNRFSFPSLRHERNKEGKDRGLNSKNLLTKMTVMYSRVYIMGKQAAQLRFSLGSCAIRAGAAISSSRVGVAPCWVLHGLLVAPVWQLPAPGGLWVRECCLLADWRHEVTLGTNR